MTTIATPIAHTIWVLKYRLKAADGSPVDGTIETSWRRVARALATVEPADTSAARDAEFMEALEDYRFLPAGRILAGADTERNERPHTGHTSPRGGRGPLKDKPEGAKRVSQPRHTPFRNVQERFILWPCRKRQRATTIPSRRSAG